MSSLTATILEDVVSSFKNIPNLEEVQISQYDDWEEEVEVLRKYLADVRKLKMVIADKYETEYKK